MAGVPHPRTVEGVLDTLRRGQRQLTRNPRGAVQAAVKQLLALGGGSTTSRRPAGEQERTYRIDDLARSSGVTVRNIRAYQERGLLPPPERVGRTALFDDTHLARLKIISSMLERGYTSANILEMLSAWEGGADLGEVLGLERALVVPPAADEAVGTTLAGARRLAGGTADLDLLVEAGLVTVSGSRARVLRPQLLEAFAEMRSHGMTTELLLTLHQKTLPAVERISHLLVGAGAAHVADRFVGERDTDAAVGELVTMLTRFRDLAMTSVTASLAASIEATIEDLLADYLAQTVLSERFETG